MRYLLLLLLASPCFAASKYQHEEPKLDDEIRHIYHEIGSVLKGDVRISSVTISSLTVTNSFSIPTMTEWASYTPSFSAGFGTVDPKMYYRRVGDTLEIKGFFTCGTVAATVSSMTIPSGLTIDTNKVPQANNDIMLGTYFGLNNASFGTGNFVGGVFGDNANFGVVFFGSSANASGQFVKANANGVCSNGPAGVALDASMPIAEW